MLSAMDDAVGRVLAKLREHTIATASSVPGAPGSAVRAAGDQSCSATAFMRGHASCMISALTKSLQIVPMPPSTSPFAAAAAPPVKFPGSVWYCGQRFAYDGFGTIFHLSVELNSSGGLTQTCHWSQAGCAGVR